MTMRSSPTWRLTTTNSFNHWAQKPRFLRSTVGKLTVDDRVCGNLVRNGGIKRCDGRVPPGLGAFPVAQPRKTKTSAVQIPVRRLTRVLQASALPAHVRLLLHSESLNKFLLRVHLCASHLISTNSLGVTLGGEAPMMRSVLETSAILKAGVAVRHIILSTSTIPSKWEIGIQFSSTVKGLRSFQA